jgi:hypothetical protein
MSTDTLERPAPKLKIVKSRDSLPTHPAADMFPMMGKAELQELANDIQKHGLQEKVSHYIDGSGKRYLLDGRNRAAALELLGRRDHFDDADIVDDCDPVCFVISKNIHRRHLTAEQRRDLIDRVLKIEPEKSNLEIAKQTKVSDKTVAKRRTKLEATSQIPKLTKTKGKDGKSRPVHKKRATEKPAGALSVSPPIAEVGAKTLESAKALSEFKYAAGLYWPRMTKKHHDEAISFVTGLTDKMLDNIASAS